MAPSKELPKEEATTLATSLDDFQRAVDQERNENNVHRSGCEADCQEHFPTQLLASIPPVAHSPWR
jgi:hypothetical protein